MNNTLYLIAFVMTVVWAIGFLFFGVGAIIHVFLGLAVLSIILRVISGARSS